MRLHSNELYATSKKAAPQSSIVNDKLKDEETDPSRSKTPIFRPSLHLGAPVHRTAGGTRGLEKKQELIISILTPDHTGLTLRKQPSFYYFLSKPVVNPIEFTIIEDNENVIDPILEKEIIPGERPGIQFIHLTDYGIHLQKNKEYNWYISIIFDANSRAKDALAWGRIMRIECPAGFQNKIDQTNKKQLAHLYANAGIWYDAFYEISNLIEMDPRNPLFRKQRASLLEQVNLQHVAQFELDQIAGL
jgi:hypothetical protein